MMQYIKRRLLVGFMTVLGLLALSAASAQGHPLTRKASAVSATATACSSSPTSCVRLIYDIASVTSPTSSGAPAAS